MAPMKYLKKSKKTWKGLSFRRRYVAWSRWRSKRHRWRAHIAVLPSSPSAESAWAFSLRLQIIAFSSLEIGKRCARMEWRSDYGAVAVRKWASDLRLAGLREMDHIVCNPFYKAPLGVWDKLELSWTFSPLSCYANTARRKCVTKCSSHAHHGTL